jgi:hypothetical protein
MGVKVKFILVFLINSFKKSVGVNKMENKREELRAKLRAKLSESKINRSSKKQKDQILTTTLKDMGIDKDRLTADMEAVKKEGGFTLNLSK